MARKAAPQNQPPIDKDNEAEDDEAASGEPRAIPVPALVIDQPGVYEVSQAVYHADPCIAPSLSRSVLKTLVDLSPAHAYVMHPKLGGLDEMDGSDSEVADYGSAAHAAFLSNEEHLIKQIDFRDWKTNAAKAARAQAYADGRLPLLTKNYSRAMRLIDALEGFRARTGAFTAGRPEQTVIWQDGPVWCRALVDWLPDNPEAPLWDLKTTAGKATPSVWSRACFEKGCDLQASFYSRGVEMIRGEPPDGMLFAVCEQSPPHAISVFRMSPITLDIADQKVREGLSRWEDCLATGLFPPYSLETQFVDPPTWVVREWEARSALSARSQEILRAREHPHAIAYVQTDDFGG